MSRSRSVLQLWTLALALSAALAAAGERWPQPLAIRPGLVWALVLIPPLLMAAVLLRSWALPDRSNGASLAEATLAATDPDPTPQGGESNDSDRESG